MINQSIDICEGQPVLAGGRFLPSKVPRSQQTKCVPATEYCDARKHRGDRGGALHAAQSTFGFDCLEWCRARTVNRGLWPTSATHQKGAKDLSERKQQIEQTRRKEESMRARRKGEARKNGEETISATQPCLPYIASLAVDLPEPHCATDISPADRMARTIRSAPTTQPSKQPPSKQPDTAPTVSSTALGTGPPAEMWLKPTC